MKPNAMRCTMFPADRLRALIAASGLSTVKYAEQVMARNPRTLRRWLAGGTIPDVVVRWIDAQPLTDGSG